MLSVFERQIPLRAIELIIVGYSVRNTLHVISGAPLIGDALVPLLHPYTRQLHCLHHVCFQLLRVGFFNQTNWCLVLMLCEGAVG